METSVCILKALLNSDQPLSGQALAQELGLSRTAVWKGVAKLREEGLRIEALRGRGYTLAETKGLLGSSLIAAALKTRWLGRTVYFYEEIDSTNRAAKDLAGRGARSGTLVAADYQTQGRGRLNRVWRSPPGANLLFSLILRPELELRSFFRMTMAAAVSLAKAVFDLTGLEPRVKWPNDLILKGLKLAGVLTEISGQAQVLDWAVVGVGLNVNASPPQEKAVCLAQVLGRPVDRLELLSAFLIHLEEWLDAGLPVEKIRGQWRRLCLTLGQSVSVDDGSERIKGLAVDIDPEGALLIETEAGLRRVVCGDLSLLP